MIDSSPRLPQNLIELASQIAAIPSMSPIERARVAGVLIQPAQELLGAERRTAIQQATRSASYRKVGEALGVTEATINVAVSQAPVVIFQFRVEGEDEWHGDDPPAGLKYETGEIPFEPANGELPFANKRLMVRYGPVTETDLMPPYMYGYATVNNRRMRATRKVQALLFGE